MNTFVTHIMLARLGWMTFLIFGIFNILAIPVIWLFYPEVAGKTLEEANFLFASNSIFASENVKECQRLLDDARGNLAPTSRRLLESVEAEFPDNEEKSAPAFAPKKAAAHIESMSTSSFEGNKITRY
jgi:hypothetical protein